MKVQNTFVTEYTNTLTVARENMQTLLRGIAAGYTRILEDESGKYWPVASRPYLGESTVTEHSIESRLGLELYGEWPLSTLNEVDFSVVKASFRRRLNEPVVISQEPVLA